MSSEPQIRPPLESPEPSPALPNPWSAEDIESILRENGWLRGEVSAEVRSWLENAARLLGPQSPDRDALTGLLRPVFCYDARAALSVPEHQAVMARAFAREVIRHLALKLLDAPGLDSERFREIVSEIKATITTAYREIFHPIRLALTGRIGAGELDRVILLLDAAADLPFAAPVKSTRQRILEFCAALD